MIKFCFNHKSLNIENIEYFDVKILPIGVTHLIFGYYFNQIIKPNTLPLSLISIKFCDTYHHKIELNVFPSSLKHLEFGFANSCNLNISLLPRNLTHLILGSHFHNEIKPNELPQTLTHLAFDHHYYHIIEPNVLPLSLTDLTFGNDYNCKINTRNLGKNIKKITYDCRGCCCRRYICSGYYCFRKININNCVYYFTHRVYHIDFIIFYVDKYNIKRHEYIGNRCGSSCKVTFSSKKLNKNRIIKSKKCKKSKLNKKY